MKSIDKEINNTKKKLNKEISSFVGFLSYSYMGNKDRILGANNYFFYVHIIDVHT